MLELTGHNLTIQDLATLPIKGPLNITLGAGVQDAMATAATPTNTTHRCCSQSSGSTHSNLARKR